MQYRPLGRTGIEVSAIAFGAGPVSGWMNEPDAERRLAVVRRAVDVGINWFDTAAGYGNGLSERRLGEALAAIESRHELHVATKVRVQVDQLDAIAEAVEQSLDASLGRLGVPSVTLLQLHNAITEKRGDEPFSISVDDVLKPGGVAEAFARVKRAGKVRCLGLTGLGHPKCLVKVIREFAEAAGEPLDSVQTPYHMLNPTAAANMPGYTGDDVNYGNFVFECVPDVATFAIRVFAGGALLGNPPSAHTHVTPFFPMSLYERDTHRAHKLQVYLAERGWFDDMATTALRFVIPTSFAAAILGFATPQQVDFAVRREVFYPLPEEIRSAIFDFSDSPLHLGKWVWTGKEVL
jgi:aryl-alcohol dehydrogenase-like predicted oxidoreductase